MTLDELRGAVPNLGSLSHADLILLLGWWLHVYKGQSHFSTKDIAKCYDALHIARPMSFSGYFKNLADGKKDLLKNFSGYRLSGDARATLDAKYGNVKLKQPIKQLLKDLPAHLPDLAEQKYLDEALICYESGALRATVVMVWNLAYAHLCDHIIRNRLKDFNDQWLLDHPGAHKKSVRTIKSIDDFNDEELKEHAVLKIALNAGIIVKNVYNILDPALKKRNAAAHPNNVVIDQTVLDGFISDIINNAVLKI